MISLLGQVVGDYRLEMTVGTGSLGETFRADDLRRGGLAAVKIIHPRLTAEASFDERFQRVVAAAGAVRHGSLLELRDFGSDRGRYFIAMDFVEGGSLRTLLHRRNARLPLHRAVELMIQAAGGLGALHAGGVLHRDLKPDNLLIDAPPAGSADPGRLRIADPGLTELAESGLTIAGTLAVGSLPYMSPEHLRGLPLDPRSDIYALGVVLYESVTGYPPFQVSTLGEALAKHSGMAPPPPRAVSAEIPAELESVVLRCLEKQPAARFQTAGELAAALAAVLPQLPRSAVVKLRDPASDRPLVVLREPGAPAPPAPPQPAGPRAGADHPQRFRLNLGGASSDQPPQSPPPAAPPAAVPPEAPAPAIRFKPAGEPAGPTLPDLGRPPAKRAAPVSEDSRRIRVALDRTELSLTPGQQAIVAVTVVNAGRTVDHFRIEVDGVPAGWVRLPPNPQQLNPGQRATVQMSVLVPRAPESAAGIYPLAVRARSRENPAEAGSAQAVWTVLPYVQASLALSPPRERGWRGGRFNATVRNEGNIAARFAVVASDDERALRWKTNRKEIALQAGQSVMHPLTPRARLRLVGSTETRAFTVRAEPVETPRDVPTSPPPAASAEYLHRALLPIWAVPLVLMVVLALAFLLRGAGDVRLAVTPTAVQVPVGGDAALVALITNRRNETVTDRPIAWSSRDTAIATVSDSGVVTGHREGSTVISAAAGRVNTPVQVAVVAARVEKLTVLPRRLKLDVGASATLRALPTDAQGAVLPRDVMWQSSDPTVVTVGGNGRVTAKGGGSATITAQVDQRTATADIVVDPGAAAVASTDDCVDYDPGVLKVGRAGAAGWAVTDGHTPLLTLDTKSDAQRGLALVQRYRRHCFLGRSNTHPNRSDYVIEYWEQPTHAPTVIQPERCTPYDRRALKLVDRHERGFDLVAGGTRLLIAASREDAQHAWEIAQQSSALCDIGGENRRPNQRDYVVQYWR